MLQYIRKNFKNFIYIVFALAIVSSVVSIVSILFVRVALNEVITNKSVENLLLILLANFIVSLIFSHLSSVSNHIIIPLSTQKFRANMHQELYEKASEIEFIKYDDPAFYNKYVMALNNSDSRALSVLNTYSSLLTSLLSSLGLIALILSIRQFLIIIIVLLNVFISTYLSSIAAKLNHNLSLSLVADDRKATYVHRVFYQNNYASDIRTTQIKNVLFRLLKSSLNSKIEQIEKWGLKNYKVSLLQNVLQAITTLLTMGYLSSLYVADRIPAGDFAAVLSSVNLLISTLKNLFAAIPQILEHSLYIENFKEFLQYKSSFETVNRIAIDHIKVINIRECSFEYEKGRRVLNNINMDIKIGDKIGIIGPNGVGKSTLIKLVTGLYRPTEGNIYLNNINYSELSKETLLRNFSVLFQNVQIYATNIAENILMKPYESDKTETIIVEEALKSVGLWDKVSKLEKGILTPMLKEFDESAGVFSTGEYQKVALARVFVKNSPVIILDEPFNHLDENSIELILNNLLIKKADSCIIMVTHNKVNLTNFDRVFDFRDQKLTSLK